MHRNDKSKFLLYIEPNKNEKLEKPINDYLTQLMELNLSKAIRGNANYSNVDIPEKFYDGGGWRGSHKTDCGEKSSNYDYLLENGMIVNDLSIFYLKWYRNSIHENDWNKLRELGKYYNVDVKIPPNIKQSNPTIKPETPNIEKIMVDELTKSINNDIFNEIMRIGKTYNE